MVKEVTVKEVIAYFEIPSSDAIMEWKKLSPQDKKDLKDGLSDGSYNY